MKALVGLRNFLYDSGFADSVKIQRPVISVGNLSMGGTGKTPIVSEILRLALQKNLKPLVIARNYKAQSRKVEKVNLARANAALYFGDEAYTLAQAFPEVSVYTGPKKYQTAQSAEAQENFDLMVVDDGFQHRALQRDLDVVLIDASRPEKENQLFPQGRFREDFSSLKRADVVCLTKVNWAEDKVVEALKSKIRAESEAEICEVEFHQEPLVSMPLETKVISVAGIANPEIFESNLQKMGMQITKCFRYPDHHAYRLEDVKRLLREMEAPPASGIVTTEKDFVKLSQFSEMGGLLNSVGLRLQFKEESKVLNAFLDKSSRQ